MGEQVILAFDSLVPVAGLTVGVKVKGNCGMGWARNLALF